MERDYSAAVIIGRFQPFHNNHKALLDRAFQIADKVIVLVGSAHAAPSPKNPFSFEDRKAFIRTVYPETEVVLEQTATELGAGVEWVEGPVTRGTKFAHRLVILPLRDYFYSDSVWVANVQALTEPYIEEGDSVALMGAYKDSSSYYLNLFPQWEFVPVWEQSEQLKHMPSGPDDIPSASPRDLRTLSGSLVRERLFCVRAQTDWEGKIPESDNNKRSFAFQDDWFSRNLPKDVAKFLSNYRTTKEYARMVEEWDAIEQYKESWEGSPFPPMFVTADAVVICSGHVLVVKRGFNPGKGMLAVPGGFVRSNERIRAAAVRELKEETRIKVDKLILDSNIVDSHVFDYPERSLRGRTITHAFHIKLKDGKLPEVKQGSDAAGAFWLPLMDVGRREHEFFEDHAHIINYFVNKS